MSNRVLEGKVIEAISREVGKSPLTPDVESFLESLELASDEEKEVVRILNDLKFQGDNLSDLPKNPPEIVSGKWG